jgi:type VI secretion system protein ImpG
MDRRFIQHYEAELTHLRQVAGEFSRSYPEIAPRLDLSRDGLCDDPHVERLLEGFAFLTARIQLRLEAEFPRFTQGLLETIYPHYLTPTPATAIVHFEPKLNDPKSLLAGYGIPRGTQLRAFTGNTDHKPCAFTTAHPVTLWPLQLIRADYMAGDLSSAGVKASDNAAAVLRLRFQLPQGCTFAQLPLDRLTLYIKELGRIPVAEPLYEDIFTRQNGLVIQTAQKPAQRLATLPAGSVRSVGFEDNESLLPIDARVFQGYRLLREYFACPQRFLYVELSGLKGGLQQCKEREVDVLVLLKRRENPTADRSSQLEDHVDASHFSLFSTPAINLFPVDEIDRIPLDNKFNEFRVVPDRIHPLDFEVFQVQSVTGYGMRSEEVQQFKPFYFAPNLRAESGAFFTSHRVTRPLTADEIQTGAESSYVGSEVYLSLVDAQCAPFRSDLSQLGVTALCSNRHLPLQIPWGKGATDFQIGELPCTSVRCIGELTAPVAAEPEGELTWRTISHLALNYFSLTGQDAGGEPVDAAALRELLKVYADLGTGSDLAKPLRRISGLRTIQTSAVTRRLPEPGPITFGRGLRVTLEFDEEPYAGLGVFLIGAVLERFLARAASINSFVETAIRTKQRHEIMLWPARMGNRRML